VQDKELYSQILGVREPWRVESADLKLSEGEVHVHLARDPGLEWFCPECGKSCPLYDHQPERRWRHLDTCSSAPPRSNCPVHGGRSVKLPWAEPSSRFAAMFERLAIDRMKAASQKAVADQLHLSWDEVHASQDRAVKRGLARRQAETISHLGMDEKSFTKGHHYFTLVNDLERSRFCAWPKTAAKPVWTLSGRGCPPSKSTA
jgi:transposase